MRRSLNAHEKSDCGLTLLELAVAIFILALGSFAALRAVDQSRLEIGAADDRLLARVVAQNRAEALRLPGAGALPAQIEMAGRVFIIRTALKATEGGLREASINVTAPSGVGALLVTYLPGGPAP